MKIKYIFAILIIVALIGCEVPPEPIVGRGCGTVSPDSRDECCQRKNLGDKYDTVKEKCITVNDDGPVTQAGQNNFTGEVPATQDMKEFDNIEEVRQFLLQRQASSQETNIGVTRGFAAADEAEMVAATGAPESPAVKSDSAEDFSQTNVQYAEVDEADFVKNDGQYIYIIADNELVIVDAYDAENAEIISETEIDIEYDEDDYYYYRPTAREIFINDDKLVLFVEAYEPSYYFEKYDIEPRRTYKQVTYAFIYDVSDREDPEISEEFKVSGGYYQSRMIDDIVYMVTRESAYRDHYVINEPMVESSVQIIRPSIYYFDNPDENYQFNTVTSIDVDDEDVVESKSFMLGYSNTLMVSEKNIYIAYQKQNFWRPWYYSQQYESDRFYDVVVPLLEGDLQDDIEDIIDKGLSEDEEWNQISDVLAEFFREIDEDDDMYDEYEDMLEEISDALEEYDTRKALENRQTVIHKIKIDDGDIDYDAQGEVAGSLLNQFSMDENEDYLRVATTVNIWVKKNIMYNNVYVLDDNMETVGKLENVAEDESIYSTRFVGDRLYMVTFRRIDPFFVIDLSTPEDPEILGKLKIPGYSDYLHPYDEDHIIGIGKETSDDDGRIHLGGVKIAMFDVSDVKNPEEIDKVEIGDQGSDSAVLHDHKAFLFSREKNLLVLPITEVTERTEERPYVYSNRIWHGAYAFHVDEDGFDEIGTVKHSSQKTDYWRWWHETTVSRSLYMDNNLYTISNKYIKINDLGNDLEELNSIKLPYSDEYRRYYR